MILVAALVLSRSNDSFNLHINIVIATLCQKWKIRSLTLHFCYCVHVNIGACFYFIDGKPKNKL